MPLNFLEYYNNTICPKLKTLDVTIKSDYSVIDIQYLSSLLDISENEIIYISKCKKISSISSRDIITIMLNGSSYLCRIFRKIFNIGYPEYYTAEELSYIYILNYNDVKNVFDMLNIDKISAKNVSLVFKHINYRSYPLQFYRKPTCLL